MDTDYLNLFVRVARRGGFAPVAREEGIDPSVVSRQIAALEHSLGFRLFHRSTRKVTLTSAGALYLNQLPGILDELEQARECALKQNRQPQGRLVLTASTAFGQSCLLPLMPEFRRRYPQVELDLRFCDAVVDILSEQVDLACRLTSSADPNLVGQKLFDTRFWVCASPEYLRRAAVLHGLEDLPNHQLLAINLPGYRERWRFYDAAGCESAVTLNPSVLASNALALRELTLRGMGCSLLASWLVKDDLEAGRLVRLFPDYRVTATDIDSAAWLLYPSRRYIPAKTRVMVDFLKQSLGHS